MKPMPQLRRLLPLLALAASLHITAAYYDPAAQRWINRDPLGERGGIALYGFVGQAPTTHHDPLGRASQPGSGIPKQGGHYITIIPGALPVPGGGCDGETQRYAEHGLSKACEQINSQCFADCLKDDTLLAKMRTQCANATNVRFHCPSRGEDSQCEDAARRLCGYATPGANPSITLCPAQLNSPGCEPGRPECHMAHELAHLAGVPGEGPDSGTANRAEKCVSGCPGGAKHSGEL